MVKRFDCLFIKNLIISKESIAQRCRTVEIEAHETYIQTSPDDSHLVASVFTCFRSFTRLRPNKCDDVFSVTSVAVFACVTDPH